MNSRTRFLSACERRPLDRPPIWVMRQAGRYLPEYRKLKESYSFVEMVQTPELAAQITLQPLNRFNLDAAILFSDILVIPEAMGQAYSFRESGGIQMNFKVDSKSKIDELSHTHISEKLSYVADAIRMIKTDLNGEKALIGFGGSPWTLATYMVEGGSSKNYTGVKSLYFREPKLFDEFLIKITNAIIEYFHLQIEAGVDVIQIFDSWGGVLTEDTFWSASGKYIKKIIDSVKNKVRVIVFSKGAHAWVTHLQRTGADVLGLDWTIPIHKFYDDLGGTTAVQGNLDPVLLNTTPEIVHNETIKILKNMKSRPGHIFNLGHGILPDAKIECMDALVETVTGFSD